MLRQRVLGDIKKLLFSSIKQLRRNPCDVKKKGRLAPALQTRSIKSRLLKVAADVLNSHICIRFSPCCELRAKKGALHFLEGTISAAGACLVHQVRHVLVRDHLFTQTDL